MSSFRVFLYSLNRIGGDCETGLRRWGLFSWRPDDLAGLTI